MKRETNYKTMRVVVGIIAILLAPLVHFFSGSQEELTSISISYWTDARDIFVGSLVVAGFFYLPITGRVVKRMVSFTLVKRHVYSLFVLRYFPPQDTAVSMRLPLGL